MSSIVWIVASELVARRGENAVVQAKRMSRELEQSGDLKGAAVWKQVAEAAEAIVRPKPSQ